MATVLLFHELAPLYAEKRRNRLRATCLMAPFMLPSLCGIMTVQAVCFQWDLAHATTLLGSQWLAHLRHHLRHHLNTPARTPATRHLRLVKT